MAPHATVLNLAAILEQHARRRPHAEAVVSRDARLTYAQLDAAANRTANALVSIGVRPGDHVALMCPNVPQFLEAYFGILRTGAVVVPLNVVLRPREIACHLRDSDAVALMCYEAGEGSAVDAAREGMKGVSTCRQLIVMTDDPASSGPLKGGRTLAALAAHQPGTFECCPTAPDDTAVIMYTSGSTGQPKGAELTHLNLVTNALAMSEIRRPAAGSDGRHITAITLPLFHCTAQTSQMNAFLHLGGTLVLLPRFDPGALLAAWSGERVTHWIGVPTMFWSLLGHVREHRLDAAAAASSLKLAVSAGAPMPRELMREFVETFGIPVVEGYGMTEASPVVATSRQDRPSKPGTVGEAIFGVEVRTVDADGRAVPTGQPGEIVVRGPNVMKGYYRKAEATRQVIRDGWLHTGDIGTMDDEGYITIVGRKKDVILRGGFSVYPREIEDVLASHPGVAMAAVVGVPDERLGEEIKAFVVKSAGAEVTGEDLRSWCRERLAPFKCPRFVEFRAGLPAGATGKVLNRALGDRRGPAGGAAEEP